MIAELHLSLVGPSATDLADIASFPGATSISIRGSVGCLDGGLSVLRVQRTTERLELIDCDITDAALEVINQLESLRHLDLSFCNRISSTAVGSLGRLPNLETLTLNWCYDVSDAAFDRRGAFPAMKRLSLWSLEDLTDIGMCAIANMPRLERLELPEFAHITDEGLGALATRATRLRELRLVHVPVTDAGLLTLAQHSRLARLAIDECSGVTDSAISEYRRLNPQCQVVLGAIL